MTPTVVVNENGVHIITGPGGMCECGIDEKGRARSCINIIEELVRLGVHEFLNGKVKEENTMSKVIRCKAVCTGVTQEAGSDGKVYREVVKFCAVYSSDPASENKWFSQWTPCFDLVKAIDNPDAFGTFKKDKKYYVDFTEAPDDAPVVPVVDCAPAAEPEPVPVEIIEDSVSTPTEEVTATVAEASLVPVSEATVPEAAPACVTCDPAATTEAAAPEVASAPAPEEIQPPTTDSPLQAS